MFDVSVPAFSLDSYEGPRPSFINLFLAGNSNFLDVG